MGIGKKDFNGNLINKIHSRYEHFVIYEIQGVAGLDCLKFHLDIDESDSKGNLGDFNKVMTKYSELKAVIYKIQNEVFIKSRIANIVSIGLNGDVNGAVIQFQRLIDEINREYDSLFVHRLKYLVSALAFCSVLVVMAVSAYLQSGQNWLPPIICHLCYVTAGAGIGGFLSVSARLKKMTFEQDVSGLTFIAYGVERMFIAVFAGVIVYFAIRANLIAGMVRDLPNPLYGYVVLSIAAGFSETLIPNLLIKIEQRDQSAKIKVG